mmetsp:Transcript_8029/g.10158  ORF Transcript_8029/g.10158 Transcript_8029/m.10158 type:complete len:161 (-) Transcript_8029:49-531(-)
MSNQSTIVINTYRSLAKLVRRLPEKQQTGALKQLRDGYRKHADEASSEKIADLIQEAGKKIAFLRIVTPKDMWTTTNTAAVGEAAATAAAALETKQSGVTRWVYRSSGEKDADGKPIMRKSSRVVSNFDGKNLDPCNVNRHNSQLKRMGFANNLHAKGLF